MRQMIPALALLAVLGGCTWVKMAPGAAEVRVVPMQHDLSACERRGEVSVSVRNRLGPYERNNIKVRDELETLARNEAPGLGADTVQPKGEPDDGEQRFLAYLCRGQAPTPRMSVEPPPKPAEAETYPIDD